MAIRKLYFTRKTHRYLGVILGIQFLVWTISGLYFSWTDIDEIHGDFQRKHPPHLAGDLSLVSPDAVFASLGHKPDSIHTIQLVGILGEPHYSIQYFKNNRLARVLANAQTGSVRPAISKEEAIRIAAESFNAAPKLSSAELITSSNGHHEYREKPLPAWAVTFDHPSHTTVYVSSEIGKVESFRNNKWRVFDFLWMGHTMGYQDRDDINNWLLRIFSVFGLLTVVSGIVLYFVSSRRFRSKRMPGN